MIVIKFDYNETDSLCWVGSRLKDLLWALRLLFIVIRETDELLDRSLED
jgi:hypothetical protein